MSFEYYDPLYNDVMYEEQIALVEAEMAWGRTGQRYSPTPAEQAWGRTGGLE